MLVAVYQTTQHHIPVHCNLFYTYIQLMQNYL